MNIIQQNFRPTLANCTLNSNESPVKNGLSYTPADMRKMQEKGYPVAPQSLSEDYFSDTDNRPGNNFDVDIFERRGVSINDVWENQQDSRKKIIKAHAEGLFESVKMED